MLTLILFGIFAALFGFLWKFSNSYSLQKELSQKKPSGGWDFTRQSFHHPAHGTIWQCLVEMRALGNPIDLVTVTQAIYGHSMELRYGINRL